MAMLFVLCLEIYKRKKEPILTSLSVCVPLPHGAWTVGSSASRGWSQAVAGGENRCGAYFPKYMTARPRVTQSCKHSLFISH